MAIVEHHGKRYITTKDGLKAMDSDYFKKDKKMNQSTADRHYANGDGNLYALDKHLDAEDERAEQLEEFLELATPHLNIIEEQIFHLRNKADAFPDINLEDEIKNLISELL